MNTRYTRFTLLIAFACACALVAGVDGSARYYNATEEGYYDILGRELMPNRYYTVYNLFVDISDEGYSDLGINQDRFWDRYKGRLYVEDVWLKSLTFGLEFVEGGDVFFSPLSLAKTGYDGIHMLWRMHNLRFFERDTIKNLSFDVLFSRVGNQVIGETNGWESFDVRENDYLIGASFSFGTYPLYLFRYTPPAEPGEPYIVSKMIPLVTVNSAKVSVVRQLHNNSQEDAFDLRGNAQATSPRYVYVKITPVVQDDYEGTAHVYAYESGKYAAITRVTEGGTGATNTGDIVSSTGATVNGMTCVLEGDDALILRVELPLKEGETAYIDDLAIELDIGGSYIVQANVDTSFLAVDLTRGLPADAVLSSYQPGKTTNDYLANRGKRSFAFGMPTSRLTTSAYLDVDFMGVLNVIGEVAWGARYTQFPTENKTYHVDDSLAVTVNAVLNVPFSFAIEGLSLVGTGDYHMLSPDFTGTFYNGTSYYNAIDDNDDNDEYEGAIAGAVTTESRGESEEYDTALDANQNGTLDYQEEILRAWNDDLFFRNGEDRNNNTIPDEVEDDALADYPFLQGTWGYHAGGGIRYEAPDVSASLVAGAVYEEYILSPQRMQTRYFLGTVFFSLLKGNTITCSYEKKVVEDTIRNDYIYLTSVTDPLFFENSEVDTVSASALHEVGPFSFNVKGKYLRNYMVLSDSALHYAGTLARIHFERPINDLFSVKITYKVANLVKWSDAAVSGFADSDTLEQTFVTLLRMQPGTVFTLDLIYSRYHYNNKRSSCDAYTTDTGALLLSGGLGELYYIVGLELNNQRFEHEDSIQERVNSTLYELTFQVLSKW